MTTNIMTKAGAALMTIIGKGETSFFDGGIVSGQGIWHETLTGEVAGTDGMPKTAKGVAGVIRRLVEQGMLEVSDTGEDGVWVALTEQGAAEATALAAASAPEPTQQPKKATSKASAKKASAKPAESVLAEVQFYRLRKSGTIRRLPYLAPGSPERKDAEKVAAQVAKGKSVATIAEETGRSLSTVRRMVAAVQLAEEVETGKYDDQVKDGKVVLPAREEAK